jgi:hypothetical protein
MADKKKKFTYIPREDKRTNPEVRLDNTFPPTLISSPNQSIEELISLYNQGFLTSDDTEEGTYSLQGFPVRSLLQNESISTPPVFPEDRAPAPMHTLPYSIEDIRQVGHVPEVQSLLRSVEYQPRQEVATTQRWSDHHDRMSGVSAEARKAEQARIERDYPLITGMRGLKNNWTIDELLQLMEEDPEAFSLLMNEYFFEEYRRKEREGVDDLFNDIEAEDNLISLLSFLAEKGAKGGRLLSGLGMALWPTSTVSQEEEDRQLRMHRGD